MVEAFSIESVGKSGARFDPEKARWFNHQYMLLKDNANLARDFFPVLNEKGLMVDNEYVQQAVGL